MASIEDKSVLVLTLEPGPRPVSALSAFLRTLQAALRETAATEPIGAPLFEQRPGPTLAAEFSHDGAATVVSFRFCDSLGAPLDKLSGAAFQRFIQDLSAILSVKSQRDLWGSAVYDARALANAPSRIREVLEDLSRLGRATMTCGHRRVELNDGTLWQGDA